MPNSPEIHCLVSTIRTAVKMLGMSLILTFSAIADSEKEKFCDEHKDLKSIVTRMRNYENMVGVGNSSGFLGLNTGVCWWHSRFQRNSSYLVQMAPELPAPTKKEAKEIIKRIIAGKEVVIVPGPDNFRMFTFKHRKEVESALRGWINRDFILRQDWTKIFKGDSILSVADFQMQMENIYQDFTESDGITFIIINTDSEVKHSWLITDMSKAEDGWNLSIVDSESALYVYDIFISKDASSILPHYQFPQNKDFFRSSAGSIVRYNGVGYVHQKPELQRLKKVVKEYCEN